MSTSTALESGLLLALVWLALLPLILGARRTGRRARTLIVVALCLTTPAVLAWAAIRSRTAPVPELEVRGRPIEVPTEGYVSSKTCEACHPNQYASWHRSYHRTMTQVATPETILGNFDDVHLVWKGQTYDFSIEDGAAWVATGGVKRKVVMSTGSHHDQMYWLDAGRDDRLLFPLQLYHSNRLDRWLPLEAAYLADERVYPMAANPGDWNFICFRCHATVGTPRITLNGGPENGPQYDTEVVEFGIACEACHGPAGEHIRRNRNPFHRLSQYLTDVPDGTITNPEDLDSKRSSRICGQCHAVVVTRFDTDAANHMGFKRNPYRPGMKGPDPVHYVRPRVSDAATLAQLAKEPDLFKTSFWKDGMVRISGRDYSAMIESPCYEKGELACSSCHDMHKKRRDGRSLDEWAHYQVSPKMYGNRACTQCHGKFEDEKELVSHTHHLASSSGSSCYNCHMPYTTYGMLEGIRSHQIASPTARESVEIGRPNACNLCHLDQTLAWTADKLEAWYKTKPPEFSEDQKTISAGALWALTGDAGTRALTAYSMGWEPAMSTSKSDWMAPILTQLLADPYYAVRFIASQSLKKNKAFADFDYDFVKSGEQQQDAMQRAWRIWSSTAVEMRQGSHQALLRDEKGEFLFPELERLLRKRDDTPIFLAE